MGITNGGGDGGGDDCIISSRCFPGGWGAAATSAKPCDYCKIAAALVFCRVEAVFMCLGCDTKVHASNRLGSKHERVWVCEVCEHAPAAVTCKADAAALCVTCDRDIHSANPLARRHERVPVAPFYDSAESVVKSIPAATLLIPVNDSNSSFAHNNLCSDSWVSSTPITSKLMQENTPGMKSSSLEFSLFDSDNFLDFEYPVSWDSNSQNPYNSDRVVPIQTVKTSAPNPTINQEKHFEIDFTRSNITSYNSGFIKPSLSVSSSMDVGVVPDGSTASDISYRSVDSRRGGGSEWNNGILMDREARVLRYREKRKNRKFEKTIRYASRKAYAETRPRIKGRFAKRTEVESESDIDTLFSSSDSVADVGRYGVVPSLW